LAFPDAQVVGDLSHGLVLDFSLIINPEIAAEWSDGEPCVSFLQPLDLDGGVVQRVRIADTGEEP
jgi:hypothetical protein